MNHPTPAQTKKEAGFTLIEVALSATVMLFVIAGMLSAVTSGAQMLDSSNRMVTASNLITHHVNELRLEGWDEVSRLPANRSLSVPDRFSAVADGMSINRTVVEEDTNLYRVTFAVSWTGITGRNYTESEDALFAKNGLSASYGY
jgi:Tfp pilus assembly protein PilV